MSQISQSASLSLRQSFDVSACSRVAVCNSSHEFLFPSSELRELIRLQCETVGHVRKPENGFSFISLFKGIQKESIRCLERWRIKAKHIGLN